MARKEHVGNDLIRQVADALGELDTLHAHLRAVVAQGKRDPTWTGWVHALEMLIPGSPPRLAELKEQLRAKGMGHLADRLDALKRVDPRG